MTWRKFFRNFFFERRNSVTIVIMELSPGQIELIRPLTASVKTAKREYIARFDEADLEISGQTLDDAVSNLKSFIVETWKDLVCAQPVGLDDHQRQRLSVLNAYIAPRV